MVTAAFGLLLASVGLYLLVAPGPSPARRVVVGVPLLLLGAEAVIAARRGRESWLSRVGPLP